MTISSIIKEHYDNNATRNHYNNTVAAMSDSEGVESYDDAIASIAATVEENGGDLDDAVAMYDSMIMNLQAYID
jgi:hypothetical protein